VRSRGKEKRKTGEKGEGIKELTGEYVYVAGGHAPMSYETTLKVQT